MAQTASYDQDPDFVRWGLQLFESDPYSNSYTFTHSNPLDGVGFYNDSDECCNADDDEFIVRALQQELSNLAVSEPVESQHDGDTDDDDGIDIHLQVAVLEQDWIAQSSMTSYSNGQEDGQQEGNTDEMRVSSSCSSPQEEDSSYCEEDWSLYSLETMDEYAFSGEVGKWLDEMVPIPHVPRINGEIPSIDEATIDHQRLLDRLQVYDLVERKVQGDGNCQFRALSDQFYRTPEHHEFVRQEVVNQLKSYPGKYEGYVPMAYADYLEKMSKSGEWGDHVTLQAAADSYGVKIIVITSFKDTCYIEILPSVQRSVRVILLSFWAEVHYNSIFPRGDVPAFQSKKKKKWRMFRNKHLESVDE